MTPEDLTDAVRELATKPGHEKVRALVHKLLTDALGASSEQIIYEHRMPEVQGRADALVGRTIIEVKRDLAVEDADAQTQLARYLPQRESETGQRYVGLATDGSVFRAYEMRDDELVRLSEHKPKAAEPFATPVWLEGVVAIKDSLPADAMNIIAELGRSSTAYGRASGLLRKAWDRLKDQPEPRLKRQLWEQHLALVYGKALDSDDLWIQHTYLVCVAKAIAAAALTGDMVSPRDLLSGAPFQAAGINGAVESDFFDWVLDDPDGEATVRKIVIHARRFDLSQIDVDLLKVLYECLIDPEKRHELGEYYTPDWLAARVTRHALSKPQTDRVLDPSCGSGTFLFHAIRQKRQALHAAGVPADQVAMRCVETVHGIDVHPVAVIIARVTMLLALGQDLRDRAGSISVPVFLGNAMQWDVRRDEHDLVVDVPHEKDSGKKGGKMLRFPLSICADGAMLDRIVAQMHEASEAGESGLRFKSRLDHLGVPAAEHVTLRTTYETYDALRRAGRNHIWGYVARNLSRPVALSDGAGMDVILGNPPWLSYRFMSAALKKRFKDASIARGVWVEADEGRLVTQIDLSGYFFANALDLYLRDGGRIAMVLPLAAMTRGQFARFRTGAWNEVQAAFTEAWVLDNQSIQPLFRVPTCVLFARKAKVAVPVPDRALAFFGRPPRKDASETEIEGRVRVFETDAPGVVSYAAGSPYRNRFRQGATLVPRVLCYVERAPVGRLGGDAKAPVVRSLPSMHAPWKNVESLQMPVEVSMLRTAYLGSSIGPFRVLEQPEAVVPVTDEGDVLAAKGAQARGLDRTAKWLKVCEQIWKEHSANTMTFKERRRGLSEQFPVAPLRVVYAASGTKFAACVLRNERAVIEHKLYWLAADTEDEAHYLAAILNSESVRGRVAHMQSRGEQGARDIDKLPFTLSIPRFDAHEELHQRLAAAGREAETVAAAVLLEEGIAFTTARTAIRTALRDDGVAGRIDGLVDELLGDAGIADRVPMEPPSIDMRQRERMLTHARAAQERLASDPAEARRLAEVMEVIAENPVAE
ncbi:MAG: N-6 DNA methylase [Parvularcula sp.]|jgi:hypothetical protein|nr:N-6 DNA methylase [Parvularcula sp.]